MVPVQMWRPSMDRCRLSAARQAMRTAVCSQAPAGAPPGQAPMQRRDRGGPFSPHMVPVQMWRPGMDRAVSRQPGRPCEQLSAHRRPPGLRLGRRSCRGETAAVHSPPTWYLAQCGGLPWTVAVSRRPDRPCEQLSAHRRPSGLRLGRRSCRGETAAVRSPHMVPVRMWRPGRQVTSLTGPDRLIISTVGWRQIPHDSGGRCGCVSVQPKRGW